jgi:hypothetical protein
MAGNNIIIVKNNGFHKGTNIIKAKINNSHNSRSFDPHIGDENLLLHNDLEYPLNLINI